MELVLVFFVLEASIMLLKHMPLLARVPESLSSRMCPKNLLNLSFGHESSLFKV